MAVKDIAFSCNWQTSSEGNFLADTVVWFTLLVCFSIWKGLGNYHIHFLDTFAFGGLHVVGFAKQGH